MKITVQQENRLLVNGLRDDDIKHFKSLHVQIFEHFVSVPSNFNKLHGVGQNIHNLTVNRPLQ